MLEKALRTLLKIREGRQQTGKRFWPLSYRPLPGADGKPAAPVDRLISVREVLGKLRRIERTLGGSLEPWLDAGGPAGDTPERVAIEREVVAITRAERPRSAIGARYSWRQLDLELFRLVVEAEKRGERFALVPPPRELALRLSVCERTLQKSLRRIRKEHGPGLGLHVHVDLWMGAPDAGHPWAETWTPLLYASRGGFCRRQEAATRGLWPALTEEEIQRARLEIRAHLGERGKQAA